MRLRGQDMEGLEDNNIKQTNIEISPVLRDLITVIFCY